MPTTAKNTAFAPLSPAAQMATDAAEFLTEEQRLVFALDWVNSAKQPGSIAALRRLINVSNSTIQEIEVSRIADAMPPSSSVDEAFMRLVLKHYNKSSKPSIAQAHKLAVFEVGKNLLECCVSSERSVQNALKSYRCDGRGVAQ